MTGKTLPADGPCERCEREFTFRDGPIAPKRFMHVVPDIARALFLVGAGMTYTKAGIRTRQLSGVQRWDRTRAKWWPEEGGHDWGLVADWVELFAHTVAGPDLVTEWPPGALLVDELPFGKGPMQRNPVTGQPSHKRIIWSIIVAMSPMGAKGDMRVARMRAVPMNAKKKDYIDLFSSLPGRPAFVLSDDKDLIESAATQVWPGIERRLAWDKLEVTLRRSIFPDARIRGGQLDELLGYWKPRKSKLPSVFRDYNEWQSWVGMVRMSKDVFVQRTVVPWIDAHEKQIANQFVFMPYYPCEASPVESVNILLGNWFEWRSFSFRNQSRTNLLLELMTAELAGKASLRNYQRRIAKELGVLKLPTVPRHLVYASAKLH